MVALLYELRQATGLRNGIGELFAGEPEAASQLSFPLADGGTFARERLLRQSQLRAWGLEAVRSCAISSRA